MRTNQKAFQYFRYFLNRISQDILFDEKRDKKDIFRDLLNGAKVNYNDRATPYAFLFESNIDDYYVFKLGRKSSVKIHLPPENNFDETVEENWLCGRVVFNTDDDKSSGQVIAFEYNTKVFANPFEQLHKLQDSLNETLMMSGYAISIEPVTEVFNFWDVVERHQNDIEKLTLAFNAPNLFKLNNSLNDSLRETRDEYNATSVTVELQNPAGKLIVPKNEFTTQGIDYISNGGGEYSFKFKGKNQKGIKSSSKTKTKCFDEFEVDFQGTSIEQLKAVLDTIFK